MAYLNFPNVSLIGLSACVPRTKMENKSLTIFTDAEAEKFIASTGVERRRVAGKDVCTSDLCYQAVDGLIRDLGWEKPEIDCLIFVSQTPDYILPATSCLLQNRLGLKSEIVALDISSGCSGWIYGLSVISGLLSAGNLKKGLLLVGDTILKTCSTADRSAFPLFGDAGTATAIEYKKGEEGFKFHLACDGSNFETIIIPEGGYRNVVTESSFEMKEFEPGIRRKRNQLFMDGMNVFSFGIQKAPESINLLSAHFNIPLDQVDYFVFHQANKYMNENIRIILGLNPDKVPYSLKDFGNTSSASIPLTLLLSCKYLAHTRKNIIACGFGVGLSWGSVFMKTVKPVCPDLIEV
ncbi:MAG: ketoacyl-ACP synthase III [Bacteroidales bacterium]|nr:ketoacyl-ACP synthase III [Bacteroidales bacterium]